MMDDDGKSTYELESLVADEVRHWRAQVDVVGTSASAGLRQRRNNGGASRSTLDESNVLIPYDTLTPTHVLFDPSDRLTTSSTSYPSSPTSTSTLSSRVATPAPVSLPHSSSTLTHSTFRTPPPPQTQAPPTPEPSEPGSPTPVRSASHTPAPPSAFPDPTQDPFATPQAHDNGGGFPDPFLFSASSPHAVPSLSLSHPLELDLELVSAPSSSRPDSPFSDFGHEQFHSLSGHASSFAHDQDPSESFHSVLSGSDISGSEVDLDLGGSEAGDEDLERWSSAGSEVSGSEISGSSWASAGVRSGSGRR
ncbi:hypothetical protein K438DRAFT_1868459 [Mycena galopus ATCC 62051]|nr:hypothetical protein K438DRAFT_1868459 [Mycena galopus ATCC 62051]